MSKNNEFTIERTTPEEVGIPSDAILDMIDRAKELKVDLHSFMLIRHGKIAAEMWWKPYSAEIPHHMYSFSKSVTATAIALAAQEGLLSLDDCIADFFPRMIKDTADSRIYSVTVRHLLTMTSGSSADETNTIRQIDWVSHFLNSKFNSAPGEKFHYNSINTYMLSAIILRVTGVGLLEYITPRLFEPLGISGVRWLRCPMGIETGGWGLFLTTEQMARFMLLYHQNGVFNGKRILNEEWIQLATSYNMDMGKFGEYINPIEKEFGYGYHFWASQNGMYRADGMYGQYGFVWPEKDLIIITTAGQPMQREVLYLIYETVFPAVDTIPVGSPASYDYDLLMRYKTRLKSYDNSKSLRPKNELSVSGKTYKFGINVGSFMPVEIRYMEKLPLDGIKRARLIFKSHHCVLDWEESLYKNRVILPLNGELENGCIDIAGNQFKVVSNGRWKDTNTFIARIKFVETPHESVINFKFDKKDFNKVTLSFEEIPTVDKSLKFLLGIVLKSENINKQASIVAGKLLEQNIVGTAD